MRRILAATALAAALLAPAAVAQEAFSPAEREEIRRVLIETLRQRPELVLEALEAIEAKREAQARARSAESVRERRRDLYDDAEAPVAGNPRGNLAIVEFFDYRCPYCKQMHAPMKALLAGDPELRVIRKDLPILGPASLIASHAALAARVQGKYPAFHDALMEFRGQLDEAAVFRIAGDLKLDVARLRRDMESPAVVTLLQRNVALAQALAISGTPAFVIGDALVPGAIDAETMKRLVAEARAKR
ncbi:MAG: DsbA family protein [Rhodospirillales bacterium]|nr:DsbA family protein [Rhodospirillales bacterium]